MRAHPVGRFSLACTGNVLIYRELFDQIGPFDTEMYRGMSDIDWMRRALDAGISSWYTPHAVVKHLIPPQRLTEEYLKWTCLRVGTNLVHINQKSWGAIRMLFPCLLRIGHALTVNLTLELAARLMADPTMRLDRKCYRWIAEGCAEMAARSIFPIALNREDFWCRLAFRAPDSGNDKGIR